MLILRNEGTAPVRALADGRPVLLAPGDGIKVNGAVRVPSGPGRPALWFISDLGGEHLLTRDNTFWIIDRADPDGLLQDDDGGLWAFHSHAEAQAFCNGYHAAAGGFVIPW